MTSEATTRSNSSSKSSTVEQLYRSRRGSEMSESLSLADSIFSAVASKPNTSAPNLAKAYKKDNQSLTHIM